MRSVFSVYYQNSLGEISPLAYGEIKTHRFGDLPKTTWLRRELRPRSSELMLLTSRVFVYFVLRQGLPT